MRRYCSKSSPKYWLKRCSNTVGVLNVWELASAYRVFVLDVPSLTYKLKRPCSYLRSLANLPVRIVAVLDYSKDEHKEVAQKRLSCLKELHVDYVLASNEPAEILAGRIAREYEERGIKAMVVSRDYDVLRVVDVFAQPVGSVFRLLKVDRDCLRNHLDDVSHSD